MMPMWSSDAGNLCLAFYFMSVFSTCSTEQCQLQKADKLTPRSATIRNVGIKMCHVKCNEKGGCLSLEYNHETLTCRLSSDEAKKIKKREGYIVQSKDHSYVQTGLCASKTCILNSRCLETRSGKAVCIDASSDPIKMEALNPGVTPESELHATSREEETRKSWIPLEPDTRATPTPASRDPRADRDLREASKQGNVAAVKRILADRDLRDASKQGNVAAVKRILAAGRADVNSIDRKGWTPVLLAAWRGHREVVELLLSKGAYVSVLTFNDDNILHVACMGSDVETVKYVLSLNVVDINARNKQGRTAVFWARNL